MSLFDRVMDQVFRAVRADRLPVAYQFSAARMIERSSASWVLVPPPRDAPGAARHAAIYSGHPYNRGE